MELDYRSCPCGGLYEKRSVQINMTVNDRLIILDNIPQGACPLCNSRVYKANVLEWIEATMKKMPIPVRLS